MREGAWRPRSPTPPAPSESDAALLAAVGRGEAPALGTLHERYARRPQSYALRRLGDRDEAEDVTQDVFLRLWLRADAFDPARGRASSWLLKLTERLVIDHVRRRRRDRALPLGPDDEWSLLAIADRGVDIEGEVWVAEQRRLLATATRALPPSLRVVVEPVYVGQQTLGEVAERLGLPLGTVKSRLARSLRLMRATATLQSLGPAGAGPAEPVEHAS
jgi:RNA polymerase sigma-70 factor (ECF subfamily)